MLDDPVPSAPPVKITPWLVLRRFLLWLVICSLSAAPSFALAAMDNANRAGMVCGVLLFVLAYTAWTSTPAFQRFYERPLIRPTLRFGYGARLVVSGVTALSFSAPVFAIALWPDMVCGIVSALAGNWLLGSPGREPTHTFAGAMLITCIQGALLNVVIFLLMLCYYGIRRQAKRGEVRRGFEVIPVEQNPIPLEQPAARD